MLNISATSLKEEYERQYFKSSIFLILVISAAFGRLWYKIYLPGAVSTILT
jgi:hypothetical protein